MAHSALWVGFILGIGLILALDMGVLHRKAHTVSLKEAACWSILWGGLALGFAGWVFMAHGKRDGLEFVTGYLIELALSVDNVFLFIVIFNYFRVPSAYQHRVLFWGILTAVVLRGIMIWAGAALVHRFEWILYVFGAFLLWTGVKMLLHREKTAEVGDSRLLKGLRRLLPLTEEYDDQKFVTVKDGKRVATQLFLALALVEATDVLFALDSIPAIFGVTQNTFIVFTSNIFAILGLRSLYFLLAGVMQRFHYLSVGLSLVLVFIGAKMLGAAWGLKIPIGVSLLIVAAILTLALVASLWKTRREKSD